VNTAAETALRLETRSEVASRSGTTVNGMNLKPEIPDQNRWQLPVLTVTVFESAR